MAKRPSQEDLQNLPARAAEYINLVIRKMRYRGKVRQDVQAELKAHFEDGLRECTTGKERDEKARQLLAEFGDVKLLATLLRRAKKRCRTFWQKALVRSFQALGIVVLYLLICLGRLTIGTPTVGVNYIDWLNKLVQADRDDSENAYPYYEKAVQAAVKMPDRLSKSTVKWPADFNDVEMQMLSQWINDNEQAIELMTEGTKKPYYWAIYQATQTDLLKSDMMANMMKLLRGYRQIAFAMRWRIRYKTHSGDVDTALSDCVVLQKFGGHFQGKGLLIEQLVGIAIEAVAHDGIFQVLEKTDAPADALKNIQEQLQELYREQEAVMDLEAEKAFKYDYVQRTFTDDGKGGGRMLVRGLPVAVGGWKSGLWRFVLFSYPDRTEVTRTIDEYFEQGHELIDKTPWQLHKQGCNAERWDKIGKKSVMLKILGPAHHKVGQITWRVKTHRAALLTVLAIKRYDKDKSNYPQSLDELVAADYLKELPIDPYSDKPLVYRRTDDNFILYSVGLNFTDDGGQVVRDDEGRIKKWADEGDWVFWPVRK